MEKREIIRELISDHWQIRDLIKDLRSDEVPNNKKYALLKRLGPWMKWHTIGEEKTINLYGKGQKATRVLAYEDSEEHATIDMLFHKLSRTRNPYLWSARLHLLCELIEHHLDEEEEEYFPILKQELSAEQSEQMARRYRSLTTEVEAFRPRQRPGFLDWLSGRPEPTSPESIFL